jgi:hypothetical protein
MQNLVPITRLGKFFGAEDFALEISMGEEWLMGDMNFTVILYRIDRYRTKTDDVYGEVLEDGIQFMSPIELKGYVKIVAPTNKLLGSSKIKQDEPGNMTFSIYQKTLEDMEVNILMGDYLAYYETEDKVRYYTVIDDGLVVSDLKHTYGGYKSFYRTITATWVSPNEFNGI